MNRSRENGLWQLITAYRNHGHHKANLDPLGLKVTSVLPHPLSPEAYDLDANDRSKQYDTEGLLFAFQRATARLDEVIEYLEGMYCDTLSLELAHIGVSSAIGVIIDLYGSLCNLWCYYMCLRPVLSACIYMYPLLIICVHPALEKRESPY